MRLKKERSPWTTQLPVADDLPVQVAGRVVAEYVQTAILKLLLHRIHNFKPRKHCVQERDDVRDDEDAHPYI